MSVHPQLERRERVRGGHRPALGAAIGWLVTIVLGVLAFGVIALGVGPHFLPYRAYAIHSGSMAPALSVGSEAILRPADAADLRPGDVIAFHKPNGGEEMVTHRIVRVETVRGDRRFVTKGDANDVPDAWRVRGTGSGWRVVATMPYAGYVVQVLRAPLPRLIVLALVLFWIGSAGLRRIWSREPGVTTEP